MGIPTYTMELGEVWELHRSGRPFDAGQLASSLRERNIGAVLSSSMNGLLEWPCVFAADGRPVPFFEQLGIPHLMWWTDHPQWANERIALREDLQAALRSASNHHFVKSDAAAGELRAMLGWPNCYGLPVAEDPHRLQPAEGIAPQFDVVTVVGCPPNLDPALEPFLAADDPSVEDIRAVIANAVRTRLEHLWQSRASKEMIVPLTRFGDEWTNARRVHALTASWRLFEQLSAAHADASAWLRRDYRTYFDAVEILWAFGRWQRTFYIRYLAKYFRLGVLGADWSGVGLPGGQWVDHDDQPAAYAQGRVALNSSQAGDEEGVAHKPFQIAACGAAMAHIDAAGLAQYFEPQKEVAVFATPREAREVIANLLDDPQRRTAMARAARERLCHEHTWDHRLTQMLDIAGVPLTRSRLLRSSL